MEPTATCEQGLGPLRCRVPVGRGWSVLSGYRRNAMVGPLWLKTQLHGRSSLAKDATPWSVLSGQRRSAMVGPLWLKTQRHLQLAVSPYSASLPSHITATIHFPPGLQQYRVTSPSETARWIWRRNSAHEIGWNRNRLHSLLLRLTATRHPTVGVTLLFFDYLYAGRTITYADHQISSCGTEKKR